jgi:hypothetical protein
MIMKRILHSLLLLAIFSAEAFGQCNAVPQTVSTSTTSSVCLDGSTSYTVTVDGSEIGYEYLLVDTLDGTVIDGPIAGTGSAIDFTTGILTQTTTFEVLAQTPPVQGSAFRIGGVEGDYARSQSVWNFDYTQGYTLEFTFNGNTNPLFFYNTLFSLGTTSLSDLEVYFQQATASLVIVHGRGQSSIEFNQYTAPATTTDVNIAIVFDPAALNTGDIMKVYYDGVLQSPQNTSSLITTMNKTPNSFWNVGEVLHNDFANLTTACNGAFDEIRIWDHARAAVQISASAGSCVSPTEQGLAHYYKFDDNAGYKAVDATANGLTLDILTNVGNPDFVFWTNELVACTSDCQVSMSNTVTIGDLDAPTVNLNSSFDLALDANGNATLNVADLIIAASDNCTDSLALVFDVNPNAFSCGDLGANSVSVTVTDEGGNAVTVGTSVNVIDTIAPIISLTNTDPIQIALIPGQNVSITPDDLRSIFSDNCDSNPLVSLDRTSFGCSDLGNQTITITAIDNQGNRSIAQEVIKIVDNTAPTVITRDTTVAVGSIGEVAITAAMIENGSTDNCTGATEFVFNLSKTTFSCADLGSNTVTLTVVDASGNEGTATAVVTVIDTIAPIAVTQDITVNLDQTGSVNVSTSQVDNGSSDNCSFTLTLDKSTFSTADIGENTVMLTVRDAAGNEDSAEAVVTVKNPLQPQSISFPVPEEIMYGSEPVELAATASSGLPVSYQVVSGPGTIVNGDQLQITGAGNVVIEGIQAGNDTTAAASSIVALTVAKAVLTATAQDVTIVYNSNSLISFSLTYTGFVNDDDAFSLTESPSIRSTGTASSDAGIYDIIVEGGSDENYDFNYVNGVFTIEKADQTLTFPALDDVDLATTNSVFLSASSDAGLPIQYSLLKGAEIATLSNAELTLSGTGTVTVQVVQSGTSNYNEAINVTQSFTVTDSRKTDQTITFEMISEQIYGNQITLNANASSNLEVEYALMSGQGTITNGVLSIEGVGDYEVEASQSGNDDFNAAPPVTQQFSVAKAIITAKAVDQTISEGEDIPTLSINYDGFKFSDDISVLDFLPDVSTSATNQSAAGEYDIILSGGSDDLYGFELINGRLIIEDVLAVAAFELAIYPNPATSVINISGDEIASIRIFNSEGKLISTVTGERDLDVRSWKAGLYTLVITDTSGGISSHQVIRK